MTRKNQHKLPTLGACLPCKIVKVRDGDTVEVTLLTGAVWAVRMLDCWCHGTNRGPEVLRAKGRAAKEYVQQCVDEGRLFHVWAPATEEIESIVLAGGGANLLKLATSFDRFLGHIFVDSETRLADLVVRAGHGWHTKAELEADKERYAAASEGEQAGEQEAA